MVPIAAVEDKDLVLTTVLLSTLGWLVNNDSDPVVHHPKKDDKYGLSWALKKGLNLLVQLQGWRPVNTQVAEVELNLFDEDRNTLRVLC